MICEYCHTDRDGFSTLLPRTGVGKAYIHDSSDGYVLDISGPYQYKMKIKLILVLCAVEG